MVEKKKSISEILRRYLILAQGLLLMTFSLALMAKSAIGVAPMAALPYTVSLVTNLSFGAWICILNLAVLFIQMLIRRRRLKRWVIVFQLITAVLLGLFTDLSMDCLADFSIKSYKGRLLATTVGSLCMAGGYYFCHVADVGRLPLSSFLRFWAKLRYKRYFHTRIIFDFLMAMAAVAVGLIMLGNLGGVREGTVLVMLLTGMFYKLLMKLLRGFSFILLPENRAKGMVNLADDAVSESHFVLTVSHEYGSGGRTIARRIAHELNLPYYDSDVIQMAAENSLFTGKYQADRESVSDSTELYNLYDLYKSSVGEEAELTDEQMCRIEAQVVREIAARESCVIVGRLANYVLYNHKNSLHIFITADETERIKRVMRKEGIEKEEAIELIEQYTSDRESHCQRFTDTQWGCGDNYDITIKSSKYGVDRTAAILLQLIREFRLIQF